MLSFRDQLLPTDSPGVRELVAATHMFRPNEIDVAVELVEERLERGEASGYHFVFAEDDGIVVGYVCYGPISVTLHSFDLYWIIVDPRRQGQGIGKQLLAIAEARIAALGGQQIYIETSALPIYTPTRQFYDRCGYYAEAIVRDFYAPGDDKWIYVRKINPNSPGR